MKYNIRYIMMGLALLPALAASSQEEKVEKFAIKATAEKSIGKALCLDYAVEGMSASASAWDYGVDFGWKIWSKNRHSVEANIGLGYSSFSIKTNLHSMDYNYEAPAEADMDNETYIRYYNLDGIYQKMRADRLSIPLYAKYGYSCSKIVSLHAMLGFRFGFNLGTKMIDSKAKVFSYGVYPQYDDLIIDATYMNEFGSAEVGNHTSKPEPNKVNAAFLVGLGAEFRVYGPFSIEVEARYEGSMTDVFKRVNVDIPTFDAENAPVTYTVADGQRLICLPSYLSQSKISKFSAAVSLLYHF